MVSGMGRPVDGMGRRRRERRVWGRRTAFAGLRVAALIALLPLGSAGAVAMPVSAIVLSVWCAAVFLLPGRQSWLSNAAIALAAAIAVYVVLQSLPGVPFMPAAGVWDEASALLGHGLRATSSIAPAVSLSALPAIVVPFLVFAGALRILDTDEAAVRMLRFLAAAGVAVALFGIVQFALFPDTVLFLPKRSYIDSLTAVFINRNNAATFLGCTLVTLVGLTVSALRNQPLRSVLVMALRSRKSRRDWTLLMMLTGIGFTGLALFLTNSRAGIASTLVALCAFAVMMSAFGPRWQEPSWTARLRRAAVALGLTAVACAAGMALFGEQVLRRIELRGTEDARFCFLPDIWRTLWHAWPHGTGAGTFELAFLPYRNPNCGIYGSLDRAHNFYLEGGVTLGLGFVAATAIVYAILVPVLLKGLVVRQRYAFVPATGLAVLLLLTLHDLLDFPIQIPGIAAWSAITLAIACGTALRRRSPAGSQIRTATRRELKSPDVQLSASVDRRQDGDAASAGTRAAP